MEITCRKARKGDGQLILSFIKGLAEYEKMSDRVVATAEGLEEQLFEKKAAEVFLAFCDGDAAGFALFFYNFSTFIGHGQVYLEDLFVLPKYRGMGLGKGLFAAVAAEGVRQGCTRMDWVCLDWNQPSIDFYGSMAARPLDDWTIYRLEGDSLLTVAEGR